MGAPHHPATGQSQWRGYNNTGAEGVHPPLPLGAPLPALLELPHSCRPPRVQGTGGWGRPGL